VTTNKAVLNVTYTTNHTIINNRATTEMDFWASWSSIWQN